jgi:hypothetical protein
MRLFEIGQKMTGKGMKELSHSRTRQWTVAHHHLLKFAPKTAAMQMIVSSATRQSEATSPN